MKKAFLHVMWYGGIKIDFWHYEELHIQNHGLVPLRWRWRIEDDQETHIEYLLAYEHTADAAQILGRRIRFTDMFGKSKFKKKRKKKEKGQMVHAEKEWNKRSLTSESLLYIGTHSPGCNT